MKAVRIHDTGGPEALVFEDVEVNDPGPREVRIRQTAIGVNFIDTYHRSGLYPLPVLPHGIGMEAAGVIERIGEDVNDLQVGQRVAYASGPPGAYAESRVVAAERVVVLPDTIDERTGAAILLKGLTAEYLIRRTFRVEAGMFVLYHAAAGGVGLLACQWLSHLGATVIGTVGSDKKAELALANGCHHAIDYTREDVPARVKALTNGDGVHVVYDGVGQATFAASLKSLRSRGMLVSFGNASGKPTSFDPMELACRGSLYLTRPTLAHYTGTRAELLMSAAALFDVITAGAVKPLINQTWPLRDASLAHQALEARKTVGSSLLIV